MQKVTLDGFTAWSDTVRFAAGHGKSYSYGSNIVLLSMFGHRNAVRAIWARLFQPKHNWGVKVGDDGITLAGEAHYVTTTALTGKQTAHVLLVHSAATHQISPFASGYYLVSPDPEHDFFARLNRMTAIPFRREWREALWQLGRSGDLISPLPGFGTPGYVVSTDAAKWQPVIKQAILNGELK